MKLIGSQLKRLKIRQLLATVTIGVVLLLNTACNTGDALGARPNNPPVQMGGNNNPHKMGGDGYTDYKMSTDPKVNSARSNSSVKKQAHLPNATATLVASLGVKSNASDPIYRSPDVSETNNPDIGPVQQKSLPPLPNQKQPIIDRADPNSKVFERAGEAIQDASAFLKETAKAANARPESKANPAIGQ
ncbi:MAG: hypothetical protein C4288_10470 [Leptolyngbya sp. ERB_1_1]